MSFLCPFWRVLVHNARVYSCISLDECMERDVKGNLSSMSIVTGDVCDICTKRTICPNHADSMCLWWLSHCLCWRERGLHAVLWCSVQPSGPLAMLFPLNIFATLKNIPQLVAALLDHSQSTHSHIHKMAEPNGWEQPVDTYTRTHITHWLSVMCTFISR